MKKPVADRELLRVLVSVYNQPIQTYHYFPEVILSGCRRLEPETFAELLARGFVDTIGFDSFGINYRLSKKGEAFLFESMFRRRHRHDQLSLVQSRLPFAELLYS
jgi:hypothetical protein